MTTEPESGRSASPPVPRWTYVTAVLLTGALAASLLLLENPARRGVALGLGYVLAWRLMRILRGERRMPGLFWIYFFALPFLGGLVIGEWWALFLAFVNPAIGLVAGPAPGREYEALPPMLALWSAFEWTLLALGVFVAQLIAS